MAVYHRLGSPSQTLQTAVLQTHSHEVWGLGAFHSPLPSVKAYRGALPPNMDGIEFETDIPPTPGTSTPTTAYWYLGEATQKVDPIVGVLPYVKIGVTIRKVIYTQSVTPSPVVCYF